MGNLFSGSADSKPTVADTVDVDSADSDSDSDSTDDDFADAVDVDQVFTDTTSVDSATHDNAEDVPGNVIYETRFHVDGRLCIVTRSNILDYPCDVIGNSVSTKDTPNENVLDCSGILAEQIAVMGGQSLVDELASPKHKCWSWGEIRFNGSHDLYRNDSSPKHFCHFCVPLSYEGDTTYLQIMSLFERAMNITHDMGRSSIAFPLVGAGANNYPAMEVIKAIVDAASLFRHKNSTLKKVILERICASTLNLYQPMGLGFKEVVAAASDYSDPEKAFRKSIGVDRNTTDIAVTVLPVERGARIKKYETEVQKVKSLRTELNGKVESYGWHGTTVGDAANSIKKNGFDISMVTTHFYGKGAYFATTADHAHAYAVPNSQHVPDGLKESVKKHYGTFTVLFCKIVTGKSHFGRETMTKPDKGYDSARNKYGGYIVIFNADAILPLAIIEYTIQRKE